LDQIRLKRKLYRTHFLDGNETQKAYYKKFSNNLTKIKKTCKKVLLSKTISVNKYDLRKTWQLINSALPTKKSKTTVAAKLTVSKTMVRM